ncbi:MAG: trigger factor [Candidatus Saccharibacteria bacterium]|nr:trigger factor [Candidatus Saccharibacteria bacterium]
MKVTRKNLSTTKVQLTISLSTKELKGAEDVALVHMGNELKVPGFRKGKVPTKVVKQQVSEEELNSHTMSDAINRAVPEAFETEKLQPLDRPEVEVKKYVPGAELEFTAEVEVLPPIKLGDYKKLKITKPKISVVKKDIDQVVERMRTSFSEKKEVKRAAKDGDEATIDFKGFDSKGEAFAGGEGKDYPLIIGSKSFIPGFEEGLVGKKAGDAFDLPVTFPTDYQAAHLAGQKCKFEVKIKSVSEVVLPKVDNEFAKKCGPFNSVAELEADIKNEIKAQREHEAAEGLKDQLVEQLVAASKLETPEVLVKDQMKNIELDFTQNLAARGMSLEQYLEDKKLTREDWEKTELHDAAEKRIQAALVLAEVSKLEKITVDDDEVAVRHQQLLQQYPDPNMRQQLETPEAKNDIYNRLATEKTLDRLVELNS